MKADLPQFFDRASSRSDSHNLTACIAQAAVDFMQSGGLAGSRGPAQIDCEISGVQDVMHGPLLLFSQALRRMEFSLAAQPFKPPDAPVHQRNHALFAFKTFACSQIVSGPDQTTLRLFHFQRTAQLTRINLPAPMAQGLSHQFVIAHNGVAFKEMLLCILK
jgi:hypothetical protein